MNLNTLLPMLRKYGERKTGCCRWSARLTLVLWLGASLIALPGYSLSQTGLHASILKLNHSSTLDLSTLQPVTTMDAPSFPSLSAQPDEATEQQIIEGYGKLPLSFESNQGQTAPQVKFSCRGNGYSLFLTPQEAVMVFSTSAPGDERGYLESKTTTGQSRTTDSTVIRMNLVGANPQPQVKGLEELPGKTNYFIGNDPKKRQTEVFNYSKVKYEEVYTGIDMIYYGDQHTLEYDFIVSPGQDAKVIKLNFGGITNLRVDDNGDLLLSTQGGELRQTKPFAYQDIDGHRREVASHYLLDGQQIGFELGDYDASKPLVIDPQLGYSTYLGGSGNDSAYGITIDSAGNAYIVGETGSTNFPTVSPVQAANGGSDYDIFVTKLNAAGTALVYSTYLGGSGIDSGRDIVIDSAGNAYISGITLSPNFPTANALQTTMTGAEHNYYDVVVAKLNPQGNALVYSTYLGGAGGEKANDIAVDSAGSAYVTGWTESSGFPIINALDSTVSSSDAFVTKFSPTGNSLVYSTFIGGSNIDEGRGITVDSTGNVYLAGLTRSIDFPTVNPLQGITGGEVYFDAFVLKMNAAGSALVYSTYLGGSASDSGMAITIDPAGNAYVSGYTSSGNFPTVNPLQPSNGGGNTDAFVLKMNAAGSALIYSTYLGGNDEDVARKIAIDPAGNAYVVGSTESSNFPIASPQQASLNGERDSFITKLNPGGGALVYSTYLGGSDSDNLEAITVDADGSAYVCGMTLSTNFPTVNPFQASHGGGYYDAIIAKFVGCTCSCPAIQQLSPRP